jgi:hypothetical protein
MSNKKTKKIKTKTKQKKKQIKAKQKIKQIKPKQKIKQTTVKRRNKLQKLKKIAFKIDLRKKLPKEQKNYIKQLRAKEKEGKFQKKFAKYLGETVLNYLSIFPDGDKLTNDFIKKLPFSKATWKKILQGKKVSVKTYKNFTNFVNNNFNNVELSFFYRIMEHIRKYKGISRRKILTIINELYDFLNYEPVGQQIYDLDLSLYDYMTLTSG